LAFRSASWPEQALHALRNRLPALKTLTLSEVQISGDSLKGSKLEHLDWTTLLSSVQAHLGIETTVMTLSHSFALPPGLTSLDLTLPRRMVKSERNKDGFIVTSPVLNSAQLGPRAATPIGNVLIQPILVTPEDYMIYALHQSLGRLDQLKPFPSTLTRLHWVSSNQNPICNLGDARGATYPILSPTDGKEPFFPPTLTDLHLSTVTCSNREPFRLLPAGLLYLTLAFRGNVVCGTGYISQIPKNLKKLVTPDLSFFPESLNHLPSSLEHISFYGGLGWADTHLTALKARLPPNARIEVEQVSLTGTLLSPTLTSLSTQQLMRLTEAALGPQISCNWTVPAVLDLPRTLTSLDLAGNRVLLSRPCVGIAAANLLQMLGQSPMYGSANGIPPDSESDYNLALLGRQLPCLTSLSIATRVFCGDTVMHLPATLTSLTLICPQISPSEQFWSLLPRALRSLCMTSGNPAILTPFWQSGACHMDAMPPNIEELIAPQLKLSENALINLPISLTSVTVNSCAASEETIKLYPHLTLKQSSPAYPTP
jgi:hypothetical protein